MYVIPNGSAMQYSTLIIGVHRGWMFLFPCQDLVPTKCLTKIFLGFLLIVFKLLVNARRRNLFAPSSASRYLCTSIMYVCLLYEKRRRILPARSNAKLSLLSWSNKTEDKENGEKNKKAFGRGRVENTEFNQEIHVPSCPEGQGFVRNCNFRTNSFFRKCRMKILSSGLSVSTLKYEKWSECSLQNFSLRKKDFLLWQSHESSLSSVWCQKPP